VTYSTYPRKDKGSLSSVVYEGKDVRGLVQHVHNVLSYVTMSRERCRGTLQSHNNSEEGSKKPKLSLNMCLQLLPKGGEG